MEGYISLIELPDKRWDSRVKLPVKFLQRFGQHSTFTVAGDELRDLWGELVQEGGVSQPWRQQHHTHATFAAAEKFADATVAELSRARESLIPRSIIRYTLDLDNGGPVMKQEDRQNAGESRPF